MKKLALLLTLLVLACGGNEPAEDGPPPADGKAVTMFEGESAHLANVRMLTAGGENAEAYFILPDCDRLTFQRKGPDMPADQIFTMDLDGSNVQRVSNGEGATTCAYGVPGTDRIV